MAQNVPIATQDSGGVRASTMAILVASAFVIGASETVLWFAMRGVMELGGFVASGGPYVIAHEAPNWVWVLPVGIIALVVAMQTSKGLSDSRDTPSMMLVAWSSLFLVLGWNFLEFGLRAPGGGGLAIGWLVCAGTFFLMSAGGAYTFVQGRKAQRWYDDKEAEKTGVRPVHVGFRTYQIANAIAIVAGVAAGWGAWYLLGA